MQGDCRLAGYGEYGETSNAEDMLVAKLGVGPRGKSGKIAHLTFRRTKRILNTKASIRN